MEKSSLKIWHTIFDKIFFPLNNIFVLYLQYLDRIGQLFFGLPPPKSPSQGIFGK